MRCIDCGMNLQSDGYGEFVHRETNKYACKDKHMPDNLHRISKFEASR